MVGSPFRSTGLGKKYNIHADERQDSGVFCRPSERLV